MPQVARLFSFSGGMVTKVSSFLMRDEECELIQNCHLDTIGQLNARLGTDKVGAAIKDTKKIEGLGSYQKSDGTTKRLIGVSGNQVSYSTGGAWTSITASWTGDGEVVDFATLNDIIFAARSTPGIASYDGTTWTDAVSGAPNSRYVEVYKDKLYAAGDSSNKSRVYYSAVGDGTTWTTSSDYFDVDKNNGGVITGLGVVNNRLIIFKENALYKWDNSVLSKIASVGCINNQSIVTIKNLCYFANRDGIYATDGGAVQLVSKKIEDDIQGFNPASATYAGAGYREKYYISNGTNTFVFDTNQNNWVKYTGWTPQVFCTFINTTDSKEDLYFGETATTSFVFKCLISTDDNGSAINFLIKTKNYDFGIPEVNKQIEKIYVFSSAARNTAIRVSVDSDPFVQVGTVTEATESFRPNLTGKKFQFEFSNSTANYTPIIYGVVVMYNIKGDY